MMLNYSNLFIALEKEKKMVEFKSLVDMKETRALYFSPFKYPFGSISCQTTEFVSRMSCNLYCKK